MKKWMIKTLTPVTFNGKDCGKLINFYRIEAEGKACAFKKAINTKMHEGESIEYVRSFS